MILSQTFSNLLQSIGIASILVAIPSSIQAQYSGYISPAAPQSWYDVDQDGNFEAISWSGVYSINSTSFLCPGIFSGISNLYAKYSYGFADFNFDGKTDVYGHYEGNYGMPSIWLNDSFEAIVPSGTTAQIIPVELYGDGRVYAVRSKSLFLSNGTDTSDMPCDAYLFGLNNTLRYTCASIMTLNQYNGLREDLELSKGGDGIPGWGDMFEHTTNEMFGGNFSYHQVDLNGDGFMDYVNDKGFALIYSGDGTYITGSIAPSAQFRDFNGDGFTDYALIKDNSLLVYLVDPSGNNPKEVPVLKNISLSKFWIRDYNKDGHPDLIALGAGDSDGFYIIVLENKGDGSFKKHENYVMGYISPFDCIDFNWNGTLDILGNNAKNGWSRNFVAFEIKADGSVASQPAVVLSNTNIESGYSYIFDSADNGSLTIFNRSGAPYFQKLGDAVNSKPLPPSKPEISYDRSSGRIKISWGHGSDTESSSADLTYSLRIGTTPGGNEILNPHATADGRRLNIIGGNHGYSRQRVLNTLTWGEGIYYISVQSVDPANRGSVFSSETVFVKETPSSEFLISYDNELPGAGCQVYLETTAKPALGSVLVWNLDGGSVISSTADKSGLVVKWDKGGKKNISLSVTSASGKVSPVTVKTIDLAMADIKSSSVRNVRNDIDLDLDGKSELIISGKLHVTDENGVYSQLKKLFNQNLDVVSSIIIDHNKDGYPDILASRSEKNQLILNVDGEDMDILDSQVSPSLWLLADVDGDGYVEGVANMRSIWKFGQSFEKKEEKSFGVSASVNSQPVKAIDFDRDGFTDIVAVGNMSGDDRFLEFWKNNGNQSFNLVGMSKTGVSPVSSGYYHPTHAMGDFNGDGKVDFIVSSSSYAFGVTGYSEFIYLTYYGSDPIEVQCPDGKPFADIVGTCDMDNNGLPDVVVELSKQDTYAVIYMLPGNKYRVCELGNIGDNLSLFQTSDGNYHYGNMLLNIENAKPSAPSALRSRQVQGNVVVEWNHSIDKETPESNMRYNLSIKRKGVSGEGAYVISPLNLGRNGIRPSASQRLYDTNRAAISTSVLLPGDYEVSVQGVDLMGTPSDFSEVYPLTVLADVWIEMPTSGFVDQQIEITFASKPSSTPDFGEGAHVVSNQGSHFIVSWDKAGQKDISVIDMGLASIYIYDKPEQSLALPANLLKGSTVVCKSDDILYTGLAISADDGKTFVSDNEIQNVIGIAADDREIQLTFLKEGKWTVFTTISRPGLPEVTYSSTTNVSDRDSKPQIGIVNRIDNHYDISWTVPDELKSSLSGITVYRQANSSKSFIPVDTLAADALHFTDISSDSDSEGYGYSIRYEFPYGYSSMSDVHIPTFLKLTTYDAQTGWNLIWNAYTGAEVSKYRILRGVSADALSEIDSVDGDVESYLDRTAPQGVLFYAIEIVTSDAPKTMSVRVNQSGGNSNVTNVVSTSNAIKIVPATGIAIVPPAEALNYYEKPDGFFLSVKTTPLNASIRNVNWKITGGADFAAVDCSGRIYPTAAGKGSVRVKAITNDGSELSDEISIQLSDFMPYVMREPLYNPEGVEFKCHNNFHLTTGDCYASACINQSTSETLVIMDLRIADDGKKIYIPARKFGLFPKSEGITLNDVWVEGYVESDTLYIPSWQNVDVKENGKKLYLCAMEDGKILPALKLEWSVTRNVDNSINYLQANAPGGWVMQCFRLITADRIPEVEDYHVHPHYFRNSYYKIVELPDEEDIVTCDDYKLSYKYTGLNYSRNVKAVVDKNGVIYIQGLFDVAPEAWMSFSSSLETDGMLVTDLSWSDISDGYRYYGVNMSDKPLSKYLSDFNCYPPSFIFNDGMLYGESKYPYLSLCLDPLNNYQNYTEMKLSKIGKHSYRSKAPEVTNVEIVTSDGLPLGQTTDMSPELKFTVYAAYSTISNGSQSYKVRGTTDNRVYRLANLGWQLYADGEPVPFNSDYFPALTETYEWVAMSDEFAPYRLSVRYSDYVYKIPINQNWNTVEIVHTINFGGDISESEKTLLINLIEAGIDSVLYDDPVVSTEYFDLNGVKIENLSESGIYIRRSIRQNGDVTTDKIVVK